MKEIRNVRLSDLPGTLLDLDISADGSFIAIASTGRSRNDLGRRSAIRTDTLIFDGIAALPMPVACQSPLVRALSDSSALVVNARTNGQRPSAWIVDRDGTVRSSFSAGDGVHDVVVVGDRIAISYFDEGVFSGVSPSNEGVAVFDMRGAFEWGYHTTFGQSRARIDDCYAACVDEQARLVICPYQDFPVVRVDAGIPSREIFETPDFVHGARAIAVRGDRVFFAGPYEQKDTVFELVLGQSTAREVGTLSGRLRGLPGGDFLAIDAGGYRVMSPE